MTALGELDLQEAAQQAKGNWRRFDSFCWHRACDLDDADDWCIVYTHHRDSGLLDQSNGAAIAEALETFISADTDNPDVIAEHHHHWAVGWIDGYAIRVYRDDHITEAFQCWHELAEKKADYPVLDEEEYSRREYEATLENITDAAWRLKHEYDLPDGWEGEVFSWFWDHSQRAVENTDDQGGYPEQHELEEAFQALGYLRVDG
ncbi:MAG TPA: hypothetical protein VK395_12665 [Gemmataceae bacterium]|nr:hypothetical protein [Gemmataceae bacterium]